MQRRTNIQVSSLIMILGILTVLLQFAAYYFFEYIIIIWGIACLMSVACCHILLTQYASFEFCYHYSLFTLFVSLVIIITTYFGKVQTFLPYTGTMIGIAVINWLIPMLYCSFRYLFDYGLRFDSFVIFYRNMSILFLLFYLSALLTGTFVKDLFDWAYPVSTTSRNLLPFNILSIQIENYIYGYIPLSDIFIYLLSRIVSFVPYGFYLTLALRKQSRLPRFLALFFLPFFIELLQYLFVPSCFDIDDFIYAILGSILGAALFYLAALIFHEISGRVFLTSENSYRYSKRYLRF